MKNLLIFSIVFLFLLSCSSDDGNNLLPVDDRVEAAKKAFLDELTSPSDGWKVQYQPTPNSGSFFIILEFGTDGEVTIFSDVADNEGEFYEHTIPFRIDNALGLELIFETYGVFHYLFEQNSATFGAEFEFVYLGKDGDNLLLQSASDFGTFPTVLTLEPAEASDKNSFSLEISENLNEFKTDIPSALESNPAPIQQIILEDEGVSVFWRLNSATRIITATYAASGTTIEEVLADSNGSILDLVTGYTLLNNRLVLDETLSFVENNKFFEIKSILFNELDPNGAEGFCTLNGDMVPSYSGIIPGAGNVTMVGSLFDIKGAAFQPEPDFPYTVNIPFIFDASGQSLAAEGEIIAEKFPDASGFIFYYGFQDAESPEFGAGFILDNGLGGSNTFVREFQPVTTEGNRISLTFTDNYFHSENSATPQQEADLEEITNLLFDGVDLYAFDFPVDGIQVFKLFNPCNGYEVFLVGN